MNNMAHMRNCPDGCMVDQIRSRGNWNFYLPLFSLIHHLDLIKRLIKNCFRCLALILRDTARSKCFIMPQSTNMINISWTDWQNLTTIYIDATSEHDKDN